MTKELPLAIYWTLQEKWDYPTLHIIDPVNLDGFVSDCDAWCEGLCVKETGTVEAKAINDVLDKINKCMSQFESNIDDAAKAIRRMPRTIATTKNEPALRLWRLLECTINQHVLLFKKFVHWADEKVANSRSPNKHPFSESIKECFRQFETKLRIVEMTGSDLFGESRLSDEDQDIFSKIESKWICRTPSEITLLILRISVAESPGSDIGLIKSSLADFLDELSSGEWKSRKSGTSNPQPLTPQTFCFDATKKRLGVSRPSKIGCTPLDQFFLRARDMRVAQPSAQIHFEAAQARLNNICDGKNRGVGPDWETDIQPKFLEEYGNGPLQRYKGHVWQAIGQDFKLKDQCLCCRTYYNAVLVQSNKSGIGTDTSSAKRLGVCAESCLHAEQCWADEERERLKAASR
ncbi:MAG: hypothetical protein M1821_002599 [Bathelium mastoideum]|nr:MAG: hypothetical protein M1821_002599 [Bathelium mastoideum]